MRPSHPEPVWGPPALLKNRPVQLGLMACLLVPFFLPIPQVLRSNPVTGMLGDQVHVPLLAGLTLAIYWFGPLRGRLKTAAITALASGGAIEFLQLLVGRSARWGDFALDIAGVGMAVGLIHWLGLKNRRGLLAMVVIAMLLAGQLYFIPGLILGAWRAHEIFPVIADFEGSQDSWLWIDTYSAAVEFITDPADSNTYLRVTGGPPSRWPGAQMKHFPPDWSAYSHLKLDVRHHMPGKETVPFTVRLDDFQARLDRVWISEYFRATDQWQTFSIPLGFRPVRQETRNFQCDDVQKLLLFLGDREDSNSIEIDNIRLE